MSGDSSPDSYNSDYLPVDLVVAEEPNSSGVVSLMERCAVCGRPAFCYNYGVLSCNACKMFFRRVEVDRITYTCKYWNKCYDGHEFVDVRKNAPRCRSCRYQRCLDVGMKYIQPGKPELELIISSRIDDEITSVIGNLLFLDSRRRHKIFNYYTSEDTTLKEMVTRSKGSRMALKKEGQVIQLHEWSFLAIYASVEMFMSLDFMENIGSDDKIILLRNFALKSMLLSSAMRSLAANIDRVMTPDGKDVYPDFMYKMSMFSHAFLDGIRSRLVVRLMNLKVTNEEHVLLNMLFFCYPAHSLSSNAKKMVSARQRVYSSALLKYCLLTYQHSGPSRFTDLLSIIHVINKQAEDVNYLTTLFQLYMPGTEYRKLFVEVCHS
ncbi:hypothetical protein GCK72_020615 [Caenorhabditis remanei]|uniref:Uncharacterized protein n=1 Tax=Caenorhabditis remanei TaxID=31234 RepID=A0A6A5GFR5_CAERE|nr:hypothetical protein GCK72_020615 [Caenorhabditis remanei]KAF1754057.1 hypothetical protein GCK72_020615 [Caenorhabditis remanei]